MVMLRSQIIIHLVGNFLLTLEIVSVASSSTSAIYGWVFRPGVAILKHAQESPPSHCEGRECVASP